LFENNLGSKTGAELAQAFAAIPIGVTTLDLSGNNLGNKTGAELAQAFAAIPIGVTTLDLSGNALNNKTGAELAQAFAAIPIGVTTLDLSGNNLGNKTGAELAQAFAAIPIGVTTLDLSYNYLYTKTGAELAQVFAAIPAGVTTIKVDDRTYYPNKLLKQVEKFCKAKNPYIEYDHDIDDVHLSYLMNTLKTRKDALSYISQGLLLSGYILKDTPKDEEELHQAIDLYLLAKDDPDYTDAASFCLWEIKTLYHDIPSIEARMKEIDCDPSSFIPGYNKFGQRKSDVAPPSNTSNSNTFNMFNNTPSVDNPAQKQPKSFLP
jgi:Leucine Rich repeat